jgi:hypothetical protein
MHVETMAHPGNYIIYSNQEHVWPEGIVAEAAVEHRKLRQGLGLGLGLGLEDVTPASG